MTITNLEVLLFILIVIAFITDGRLAKILKAIKEINTQQDTRAVKIEFYEIINNKLERITNMMIKAGEEKNAILKIKDTFGNDAKIDGEPKWSTTDENMLEVVPAEGGMSAMVKSRGLMGMAKVQVLCDADLGEGVKEILGEADVEVIAGEAEVVEISFE